MMPLFECLIYLTPQPHDQTQKELHVERPITPITKQGLKEAHNLVTRLYSKTGGAVPQTG